MPCKCVCVPCVCVYWLCVTTCRSRHSNGYGYGYRLGWGGVGCGSGKVCVGKGARPGGGRHKRNIQSKIDYKDQKEQEHGRSMDVPVIKGDSGEGRGGSSAGAGCRGCCLLWVCVEEG